GRFLRRDRYPTGQVPTGGRRAGRIRRPGRHPTVGDGTGRGHLLQPGRGLPRHDPRPLTRPGGHRLGSRFPHRVRVFDPARARRTDQTGGWQLEPGRAGRPDDQHVDRQHPHLLRPPPTGRTVAEGGTACVGTGGVPPAGPRQNAALPQSLGHQRLRAPGVRPLRRASHGSGQLTVNTLEWHRLDPDSEKLLDGWLTLSTESADTSGYTPPPCPVDLVGSVRFAPPDTELEDWVVCRDGTVVGALRLALPAAAPVVRVDQLLVHPNHRRRGIGRAL